MMTGLNGIPPVHAVLPKWGMSARLQPAGADRLEIRFGGAGKNAVGKDRDNSPMTWDPNQYMAFENHRLRPALDLLGRVPLASPKAVVDLGCGTGNVTAIMKDRWPQAKITGVDSSKEMLDKAKAEHEGIVWQRKDVARWNPRTKYDVIYSNATLHWLPDHEKLFPSLMKRLKPGGYLAVQIPGNFNAPTHTLMHDAARAGSWHEHLKPVLKGSPVLDPADYYRILAPHADRLDVWETTYMQRLTGENPVAEWTKGTWLKPLLDALEEPDKSAFEAEYRKRILEAYPPETDGSTLLPFRRIFIVASKK